LRDRYAGEVQNCFDALANLPDDVELMWEAVRYNITSVASKVIGYKKFTRRQWLSAEADRLIGLKREVIIRGDHQERNRYKCEFKRTATADRERYYSDIADHDEQALRLHKLRHIYKLVAKICGKKDGQDNSQVTKADGTRCRSEDEVLVRWTEYYEH